MNRRHMLAALLLLLSTGLTPAHAGKGDGGLTAYLVRHAEKAEGKDPALTEAGQERAEVLSERLNAAGITAIYSTDYRRTQQTAAPLAKRLEIPIQSYNPRDLQGLVDRLRQSSGTVLIVGHSNTTPELVALLGGDPGAGMTEKTYDRLYMLLGAGSVNVTTLNLQYGGPSKE